MHIVACAEIPLLIHINTTKNRGNNYDEDDGRVYRHKDDIAYNNKHTFFTEFMCTEYQRPLALLRQTIIC